MILEDYLSLFPGNTREKPRFMALAETLLRQVTDLQAVVRELNAAFAPEYAQGAQLDALGASLGLSRADISVNEPVPDEMFRDYLLKKLQLWTWDGTNGSVPGLLAEIQPGAVQTDNLDGTVTVTGAGEQPVPVKGLFPVSAGIRCL